MTTIQLEFWKTQEECEMSALRKEVSELKTSQDKQRKSLFAKNGELTKQVNELNERLSILERNICNGIN